MILETAPAKFIHARASTVHRGTSASATNNVIGQFLCNTSKALGCQVTMCPVPILEHVNQTELLASHMMVTSCRLILRMRRV